MEGGEMILRLFDTLACWWLDKRMDANVKSNPELGEMGIKKAEFGPDGFHAILSYPGVVILADEAAAMLKGSGAENYIQFDMMPRLDRGKRPVRVTIQWASGESPAARAARLEAELDRLHSQ